VRSRTTTILAILAAAVLSQGARAEPGDLTDAELAQVFQGIVPQPPWHVEQVAYQDGGDRWQIHAYARPRQVSPVACISDVTEIRAHRETKGIAASKPETGYALALSSCQGVRPEQLHPVNGQISEHELSIVVDATLSILRTGQIKGARVQFESDAARRYALQARRRALRSVDSNPGTAARVYFSIPSRIEFLCVSLRFSHDRITDASVHIEDGPDVVEAK
jgi:hypothetical protein